MKKKLVLLGLIAFMLSSCVKTEDDLATISINHRYVESGSIYATRANIVQNIGEALKAIMPESVYLTIGNETSVHSCMSGRTVTLPYGHYYVSGESRQTKTYISQSAWASTEPLILVDDILDVKCGVTSYSVKSTINSFVLTWNNTVVESITISGTTQALPYIKYEDTSVCCITGDIDELVITLHPWISQSWDARSFTLTTSFDGPGIYCEKGKWYALSPTYIPSESGVIGLQCEDWAEGGNYY